MGCQQNKTMPDPGTANDAFECAMSLLPAMDAMGLKYAFAIGGYNRTSRMGDNSLGGAATYGGVSERGVDGYPTARTVQWVVEELERRNLTSTVAQVCFRDNTTP
jgi:hypothetical protein